MAEFAQKPVRKTVSFGSKREHTYDNTRSDAERRASWYSQKQFEAMKLHSYGLAKTAALLGEDEDRVLHGNCLRGLEKLIPNNKKALNSKRRRNIVRSIVELHQMETAPPAHENAEQIKATLKKYVEKHRDVAKKAAIERAAGDEQEARKVYYEGCLVKMSLSEAVAIQSKDVVRRRGNSSAAA